MTHASSLLSLAAVYLAVLASPGPNFFILSQLSLDGRRREALWTVLGLVTGSVAWVVLSLAGLSALLASHPVLATALRSLGAAYLVWYGFLLLRSALAPLGGPRSLACPAAVLASRRAAYRAGLLTGLTNPKAAAFWTSVFATLLPHDVPGWFFVATVLLVAAMSLGWHLGIALVFGLPALRRRYLRWERVINGSAGTALLLLGLQRLASR